jgi:hypothetical protein
MEAVEVGDLLADGECGDAKHATGCATSSVEVTHGPCSTLAGGGGGASEDCDMLLSTAIGTEDVQLIHHRGRDQYFVGRIRPPSPMEAMDRLALR